MARYHYDLTGAEAIVRDVPVYDSATLVEGEFIMRASGTGVRACFITGWTGTSAEMVNGLGVMNETITTSSKADFGDHITTAATTATAAISSIAATVTTGNRYGKAIINPFAVYLTERGQTSADYITATANTTTTYTDTMEDEVDGGWLYVVPISTGVVANQGQLRYISASNGTATITTLTALTTTTAEKLIKILPIGHALLGLDPAATYSSDKTAHTAADEVGFRVVENYVGGKNRPLEPLRQQVHDGITDKTLKFYQDLVIKDHLYNSMA